ncbi:MAG: hypothetical protein DI539_00030 [Flavobacterium psychrophilum]|nr:MAG: hypothetical protein DI539_00030 [Flavobacterium psychrophilum]
MMGINSIEMLDVSIEILDARSLSLFTRYYLTAKSLKTKVQNTFAKQLHFQANVLHCLHITVKITPPAYANGVFDL